MTGMKQAVVANRNTQVLITPPKVSEIDSVHDINHDSLVRIFVPTYCSFFLPMSVLRCINI